MNLLTQYCFSKDGRICFHTFWYDINYIYVGTMLHQTLHEINGNSRYILNKNYIESKLNQRCGRPSTYFPFY